jgi:hypothetical protein
MVKSEAQKSTSANILGRRVYALRWMKEVWSMEVAAVQCRKLCVC